MDEIFCNTTATGENAIASATGGSQRETSRRAQGLLGNSGQASLSNPDENATAAEDDIIQQPEAENPDWFEGDISYLISQSEELDDIIHPALRNEEPDTSSQDITFDQPFSRQARTQQGSSLALYNLSDSTRPTSTSTGHSKSGSGMKRQRIRQPVSNNPSMALYAERIANEVSEFIAETRTNKRTRLAEDSLTLGHAESSINAINKTPVADQYQPYREALGVLMEMYKEGKFSEEEVNNAIDLLENHPIHCITFVGLAEELRERWLKRTISLKTQQGTVLGASVSNTDKY